jgi:hypothetical protein
MMLEVSISLRIMTLYVCPFLSFSFSLYLYRLTRCSQSCGDTALS